MMEVQLEERPALIQAGLMAAGVPVERVELFAALTDEIITTESGVGVRAPMPSPTTLRSGGQLGFSVRTAHV